MGLCERIGAKKMNFITEMIGKLKASSYPIIIWGGQLLGGKVAFFLDENNVQWEAFAVNREFYSNTEPNRTVILEDYVKVNKCIIIVAFKGYKPEMLEGLNRINIIDLITLDFQGRFANGMDSMISPELYAQEKEWFDYLRNIMADEKSKESLDDFLHQKMYSEYSKTYSRERQYFDNEIVELNSGDVLVDCGGYNGDDTDYFLKNVPNPNIAKSIIFEPDHFNYISILEKYCEDSRVKVLPFAASDKNEDISFLGGKGTSSRVSKNGEEMVKAVCIDDILYKEKVSFIKMDIEGSELNALKGCKKIITRNNPKLAICVYHKAEDLIEIPRFILRINPNYKLFLRNYAPSATETVLYAI